jgi:hypothetical protein
MLLLTFPSVSLDDVGHATAFGLGYALATDFGLQSADPDLAFAYVPDDWPFAGELAAESTGGSPPGCWTDTEPALDVTPAWALDMTNIRAAWEYSARLGRRSRGRGIVVAQPDTGITPHRELTGVTSVPGYDVLAGVADPADPLSRRGSPGHGTATASVLLAGGRFTVTGAAPEARHMAIRAIESVVQVRQASVARAIDWAVDNGAHVISMSLGGLPAAILHRALCRAEEADVIVLAAAGNCVRHVVWPARYPECIAVAGTNAADEPWQGSSRGAAVDVSAPAQNVFRAFIPRGAPPGGGDAGQGQGTSFAVALTAGVAALWLAHHGRPRLIAEARARGETLQQMFRRLLRATTRQPESWHWAEMGTGIVDAAALLAADLDLDLAWETLDQPRDLAARSALSVASLIAESVGLEAVDDEELDVARYGTELAAALLTDSATAGVSLTEELAEAIGNPMLRRHLNLGHGLVLESGNAESGFEGLTS